MTDQTKAELLRHSKLSGELDDEQVRVLAEHVTLRDLADEEILCDEGKSDDQVHAIVSGAIAVAKRQPEGGMLNLNVLTKGDLVGELAFMDGKPHYAALKAMGPTRVLSLSRQEPKAPQRRGLRAFWRGCGRASVLVSRPICRSASGAEAAPWNAKRAMLRSRNNRLMPP